MSADSKKYQKLTDLQHVLKNPGMYIGTMDYQKREYHILAANEKRILKKQLKIVPGFIQIFQEILSNAVDHEQEDPSMTMIKVNIDQEKGTISVMNNGTGIPVVMHDKEKMYIPEMVFGEFKSGSNFGDKPRKAGGKHGIGAKATNAFSKEFTVETVSGKDGLKFVQTFSNNMSDKTKPKITKTSVKDYTKITYIPDFEKFGMKDGIDKAHFDIMKWRVFGAAATTGKKISVYFNDIKVPIKDFSDYVKLYAEGQPSVGFTCNDDWEIGMMLKENDDGFEQVSFVNGIPTIDGGQHVDYVANQVAKRIGELVKKRLRSTKPVRAAYILNNIKLFVKARIFDPDFPSQNKYTLSTEPKKFGTSCEVPDKIIDKFAAMGLVDRMAELLKFKEDAELKKQSGKKSAKIKGVPKLDDANDAGGRGSSECILVLTEGDSAKALAMAGRGSVKNGNNRIGVFPLRGKLKNVREIKKTEAVKNEEIVSIVKIMGLKYGEKYTDTKTLRYGKIMIFTDADVDGTHIKGLIINFIDHFWPDLLKIKGFVTSLATPIMKAIKRGKRPETVDFYSVGEYEKWLAKQGGSVGGWQIKYYKGLGTSTKEEAKEYFQDYLNKLINYQNCSEKDKAAMQLAFDKDKADARKKWVSEYDPSYVLDQTNKNVCLEHFINKELIHFSTYDNARSIPSVVDGFKPSQRKIIHTCFLLNLIHPKEMKVARLAGSVGEKTGYHHGEVSLQGAIVKLAQTFVGANNLNELYPGGQFGSREEGGKDASAARYIYTALTEEMPHIFNRFDLPLLEYVDEDGLKAEPYWFIPIIPMILVNGANGIGTGYSTTVLSYNPQDIINNLVNKINGKGYTDLKPWFKGFKGTIIKVSKTEYYCKGKYEIVNDKTLKITELPIGVWYANYKVFLEKLESTKTIKNFRRHDSDDHSDFIIEFHDTKTLRALDKKVKKKHINALEDQFKLVNSLKTSNMHLFDPKGVIRRYNNVEEIMDEFYDLRLSYYTKRRDYLLKKLEREMLILKMKVQFINDVISKKVKINNIKWAEVEKQLHQFKYLQFSKFDLQKDAIEQTLQGEAGVGPGIEEGEGEVKDEIHHKDYNYLKRMPIYSVTKEEKERLESLLKNKQEQFDLLNGTTSQKMWYADLKLLGEIIGTEGAAGTEDNTVDDTADNEGEGEGEGEGESKNEGEDDDQVAESEEYSMSDD